jgi:hypothetical protein
LVNSKSAPNTALASAWLNTRNGKVSKIAGVNQLANSKVAPFAKKIEN